MSHLCNTYTQTNTHQHFTPINTHTRTHTQARTHEHARTRSFRPIPLQTLSSYNPNIAHVGPGLHTWPTYVCCAEPGDTTKRKLLHKHTHILSHTLQCRRHGIGCSDRGRKKTTWAHQCVIKADVSFQTALLVFKLDNRHFGGRYRQDIPQTWTHTPALTMNTYRATI